MYMVNQRRCFSKPLFKWLFPSYFFHKRGKGCYFPRWPLVFWEGWDFIKPCHTKLKPKAKALIEAPFQIHLVDLPIELYDDEILEAIGNQIGVYMFFSNHIMEIQAKSFTRICINIDLESPLPSQISISFPNHGFTWTQPIDYKNIPFRCRIYLAYDHLVRSFPHTKPNPSSIEPHIVGFQIPKHKAHLDKPPVEPPITIPPSIP